MPGAANKNLGGIRIYHPDASDRHEDYEAQGLDGLYVAERTHFWFIARKELILDIACKYLKHGSEVLEVGAGTGFVARGFLEAGYQVTVGDIHLNGLKYAQDYGVKECIQFDLLRTPFTDRYDAVCMFDVLEHIKDESLALQKVTAMLTKNGTLMITVPAHMFLWSRLDAVSFHKRRYSLSSLSQAVEKAGLKVVHSAYFFSILVPLLAIRKLLDRDSHEPVSREELDVICIPKSSRFTNQIILMMLRLERKVGNVFSKLFGGSIILVAKK